MSFHEISFPFRLALGVSGGPVRPVDIVSLSNGRENRNARQARPRRQYDAGSAIRSLADLYEVLSFFEARGGPLYGFRFADPIDHASCPPGQVIAPTDQTIGTGDGQSQVFALTKTYQDAAGMAVRPIAKPVAGSVLVAIGGVTLAQAAYSVDPATGLVSLPVPPQPGQKVTAGYRFEVPVRFATDRIDITLSAFEAGRIPSIPLVEIAP